MSPVTMTENAIDIHVQTAGISHDPILDISNTHQWGTTLDAGFSLLVRNVAGLQADRLRATVEWVLTDGPPNAGPTPTP